MNKEIPLFEIYSDEKDIDAISRIIKSKRNWAVGAEIEEFEQGLAEYINIKYALTFNSGTSAIYSSLLAAGISRFDEVIVPAFTYIATVEPISLVGAKPVFADIEKKSLGLDPDEVKKKVNKKTKAIIAVHYAGIPCQIVALRKIADENHLILIEDAAEAFGSSIGKRKIGTYGDLSVFSFSQGKIITTGEGGAVVTKSKKYFDSLKLIRSLGRKEKSDTTNKKYPLDFIVPGHNLRLSNILAALGISQLAKTDTVIKKRMKLANYYKKSLADIKQIEVLDCGGSNLCGYQIFTILADDRDKLSQYLEKNNISSRIYFQPVYSHYLYKGYSSKLSVTEEISSKVLSIPFYTAMKKTDLDYVIATIRDFYLGK